MKLKITPVTGAMLGGIIASLVMASAMGYILYAQSTRYDHGESDRALWTILIVIFGPGGILGLPVSSFILSLS